MKICKILIANRGEIAVRVIRACRVMGISPVAVYCLGEENAMHVRLADEAYCAGAPLAGYLDAMGFVTIAKECGAQAIHPGYGFLSEQAQFAEACRNNGILFIGPSANTLRLAGHKTNARALMSKAGIPVIPGSSRILATLAAARKAATNIGYPVILKSAFGGGGKGMKIAHNGKDLSELFLIAQQEALRSFGKSGIFLERYLADAQHIEVQILCDKAGQAIHLGERNCSIQRRHQKLLEESPSPRLAPDTRKKLLDYALQAAHLFRYENAGTVEFLVDAKNTIYFLEVNARIQVEHPVTEMRTSIDLVVEQIRIAAGMPLSLRQKDVVFRGHAIECRVYAEDPFENFMPSTGTIDFLSLPAGPGIRVDTALTTGAEITPTYDSLIAKIIAHGDNRQVAIARMRSALREFLISPVRTTIPIFHRILTDKTFLAGRPTTRLLAQIQEKAAPLSPSMLFAALALGAMFKNKTETMASHTLLTITQDSPPPLPSNTPLSDVWK